MHRTAGALALFLCVLSLVPIGAAASAPAPDVLPVCHSAQDIAPLAFAGGTVVRTRSAVVWNGKDYGVTWVDNADSHLYFRRFYADGTPVGPAAVLSTRTSSATSAPDMVWNGSGYGIVWAALTSTKHSIYMVRLDANGALIAGSERDVGGFSAQDSRAPALAWNGTVYCCVFTYLFAPSTDHDIYFSILDASGTPTVLSSPVTTMAELQDDPSVAWFPTANAFVAAWEDFRHGDYVTVWANKISAAGTLAGERSLFYSPTGTYAVLPSLAPAANNNFMGIAWRDDRDGQNEIYFARFSTELGGANPTRIVPETTGFAESLQARWTGAEFGVFFLDTRAGGHGDIWFQAVTAMGQASGTPVQAISSFGSLNPAAAFGRRGWLVSAHSDEGSYSEGYNLVQPFGCATPVPPPCPENVMAYSVSGTQATLSWLPAQDDITDTAYYQVYRNNALVGITDDTVYTATGLSTGTTYNFAIRTVNAAQSVSGGCPATSAVYLKTNASLLLKVDKSASGTDAALSWSDAGMGAYNLFRGTTPQTMSLVDTVSTLAASHEGALTDNVLYFYTVDDPGQ